MTDEPVATGLLGGIGLLERAINYTLGSLNLVTASAMTRATPCRDWDLRMLLAHMDDSLTALYEAADLGHVDLRTSSEGGHAATEPVATLRNRACRLLGAWTAGEGDDTISIAGHPLTSGIVTGTGAVEIAVHGWDVAMACGYHWSIPPQVAEEMLQLAPLFVTDDDRPGRFAASVDVPPLASPSDRLIAFLGRRPAWSPL